MKTLRLDGNCNQQIHQAAQLLKRGKLVAIPTETVYGLAADALLPDAVRDIFRAKGRPSNHPLIVHIGRLQQIHQLAIDVPEVALTLAQRFWPGPLTLLLNKRADVPDQVTGGLATIGVRIPDHPVSLKLLSRHELMVAAPSANPYKRLSPTSAEQVMNGLEGKIDAVLDGGPCQVGLESTIVDLTQYQQTGEICIRRSGHITRQQLRDAIAHPVQAWQPHALSVPGNVSAHYQPESNLLLKSSEQITQSIGDDSTTEPGIVCYSASLFEALKASRHQYIVKLPEDKPGYARSLYNALYRLDKQHLGEIWLETPPDNEHWLDVNDRLSRATRNDHA